MLRTNIALVLLATPALAEEVTSADVMMDLWGRHWVEYEAFICADAGIRARIAMAYRVAGEPLGAALNSLSPAAEGVEQDYRRSIVELAYAFDMRDHEDPKAEFHQYVTQTCLKDLIAMDGQPG